MRHQAVAATGKPLIPPSHFGTQRKEYNAMSETIWHLSYTCFGCKKKKTFDDGQPTKMKNGRTGRKVTICPKCADKNARSKAQ